MAIGPWEEKDAVAAMKMTEVEEPTTAEGLATWVKEQLRAPDPDHGLITRVILQETKRWFANGFLPADIAQVAAQAPASTGDPHWDALLEGVVAYRLHAHTLSAPSWTKRTLLDEGWDPRGDDDSEIAHPVFDAFIRTPVELLHKGVTLPLIFEEEA